MFGSRKIGFMCRKLFQIMRNMLHLTFAKIHIKKNLAEVLKSSKLFMRKTSVDSEEKDEMHFIRIEHP